MDLALEGRGQSESRASPQFRENVAFRLSVCLSSLFYAVCLSSCLPVCVYVCLPASLFVHTCVSGHMAPLPSSVDISEIFTSGRCWGHKRIRREAGLCFA